jgi:hypothetical protein
MVSVVKSLWAFVLLSSLCALVACTGSNTPTSPATAASVTGEATGGTQAVGVTGVVSRLNLETRTFVVAWRGGSRLVLADGDTVVWSQRQNRRVRLSALRNGQQVAIRGSDEGRYVRARSIVVKD